MNPTISSSRLLLSGGLALAMASLASVAQGQDLLARFPLNESYPAGTPSPVAVNQAVQPGVANGLYSSTTNFTGDGCIIGATWEFSQQEFVTFPSYPAVEGFSEDFTLTFWVSNEYDFVNGPALLVGARNASAPQGTLGGWGVALGLGPDGQTPELRFGDVQSLCTTAVTFPITFPSSLPCNSGPNPTNFRHVTLRVQENTQGSNAIVECLVDGMSLGTSAGNGFVFVGEPDSTATWYVGGAPAMGVPPITCAANFGGQIVDVQLYEGQLSNELIDQLFLNPGAGPVGTNPPCLTNPNSTGAPSELTGFGSPVVLDNYLVLNVESLPPNKNGYFLLGINPGFLANPGGSAGNICLSSPVARLNDVGQVWRSDAAGRASLQIDLTQPYTFVGAQGPQMWAAGTFYFQGWHREAGSGAGNFTNSLQVVLQ